VTALLQGFLEEVRKLKSPILPVGIFLVATLCLVAWRDKHVAAIVKPVLQPLSALVHIRVDALFSLVMLFLVPLCFLLLIRENPKRYGLSLGKMNLALPVLAVFLFGFGMVAFLSGKLESIATFYGAGPLGAREAALVFFRYLSSLWGWEFITRGFLLLGLKRYVGVYAVYIQLVPFVILHLGKPPFELYGSVLFGLLFGYYAYLVDSFIYCAIVHAWFALVIDLSIGLGTA
jgi:hypothetical protein